MGTENCERITEKMELLVFDYCAFFEKDFNSKKQFNFNYLWNV